LPVALAGMARRFSKRTVVSSLGLLPLLLACLMPLECSNGNLTNQVVPERVTRLTTRGDQTDATVES
jgi:hypothetical protein